jgi:hypothetical protein
MEDLIKRILERIEDRKADCELRMCDARHGGDNRSMAIWSAHNHELSHVESIIMDEYNKAKEG